MDHFIDGFMKTLWYTFVILIMIILWPITLLTGLILFISILLGRG